MKGSIVLFFLLMSFAVVAEEMKAGKEEKFIRTFAVDYAQSISDGSYHIDYCFVDRTADPQLTGFCQGTYHFLFHDGVMMKGAYQCHFTLERKLDITETVDVSCE
jgi:hypothetical protein